MIELPVLLQATALQLSGDSLIVRVHTDPSSSLQLWVPAAVAVVVVIVGGVIQWLIAKRQWTEQGESLTAQLAAQRILTDRQLDAQRESTDKEIVASLRSRARLELIAQWRRLLAELFAEYLSYMSLLGDVFTAAQLDTQEAIREGKGAMSRIIAISYQLRLHLDDDNKSEMNLKEALENFDSGFITIPQSKQQYDAWVSKMSVLHRAIQERAAIVIKEHFEAASAGK